jgi:hypothetical protein
MNTRTRIAIVLLTAALLGGAAVVWAQESGEPMRPVQPTLTVAHPRAGIATTTQAGVENFMVGEGMTEDDPLVTLPARHTFRLRSPYEAVFFPFTAGWARFELEVWRIRSDGTRDLIGADKKLVVGFGPHLTSGGLNVDVTLDTPGIYTLALVSRTSARPVAAPEAVVDEDEVIVVIIITGEEANAAIAPSQEEHLGSLLLSSVGGLPIRLQSDSLPLPALRIFQVATPRAHVITSALGAVENFDQGHGQTIVLRVGECVRFRSSYEMVWFDGATGVAATSLAILRNDTTQDTAPIGEDSQRLDLSGPHRG